MARGVEKTTGQAIVLKHWRRVAGVADDEVREVWRQEIRQLHRLAGFPGAREYIVGLLDSSEEADGFYLALSPDQRSPLGAVRSHLPTHHFLQQPRTERSRLLIWRNLKRVAAGLDILHTQGLLHRSLDEWAVFTDGGEVPDFQLSGFEWSIRLAAEVDKAGSTKKAAPAAVIHSFLQDWHAFGLLAASLLGVDPKSLTTVGRRDGSRDPTLHLIGAERELLQRLLRADRMDRIDGELVEQKILSIVSGLEAIVGKRESQLILTCALNPGSQLSAAIREASNRTVEVDDVDAQLAFIQEDLREEPLLLVLKPMPGMPDVSRLAGSRLTYRLQPFQPNPGRGAVGTPSWAVAYCGGVASERPAAAAIAQQINLADRGIQVLPMEDVRRRYATLQGKAPLWDKLASAASAPQLAAGPSKPHRALLLLQVLEALITVADIWPVAIGGVEHVGDRIRLRLRVRVDDERERLSKALAVASPAIRMREMFAAETESAGEDWGLTDIGVLGERESEAARWRFVDLIEPPGEEVLYEFEGAGPAPYGDRLFLRQADHAGEDKLLRRRIRALRALREHVELLEMLDDPRLGVRRTHEVPQENERFKALDDSKQRALRSIWAALPLFLLQGPPGVGKTRLVRELVGRRIREDGSSRILLTAQSHHAVDHLLEEVSKELVGVAPEPLVVRSRSKDRNTALDGYDVRQQAGRLVSQLSESKLVAEAPAALRAKVHALVEAFKRQDDDDSQAQKLTADRSIEALLLRSAHFVFASTNAGDLERLIEEKSQFDWTIIEEAGKATGTELISPLLLSHRRLMIGDHKQLPPFSADRLKGLLSNPARIAQALEVGGSLVGRPFRDAGMDDVIDDPSGDLTEVCGEAAAALMMFETLVEGELARVAKARSASSLPIAQRLNQQHRMHPAIARLVSASFYANDLQTDEKAVLRFASSVAPVASIDTRRLPASPIVVVDMPFVQKEMNAKRYELTPRFHNPTEVDAVVEVLALLRPSSREGPKPTLAVLAPYREQVKKLKHRIAGQRHGRLEHLQGFDFEGDAESPTGTVDSFQGSEADAVVMSLVRNNSHAGLRGLGFLADPRRMNVLLSRARWKLVLVVSLDFLRSRTSVPLPAGQSLDFLKRMLSTLAALQSERGVNGVPLASVVKFNDLVRRSS